MTKPTISLTICALIAMAIPAAASAAGFDILAPHRAIYDLKLEDASERSGIQSITGRIVYEITGNACDGVAVRYRFVTNIATTERSYQTDQQTTTFESPDGKEFDFLTRTYVDARPEKTVRGTAVRTSDGVVVELTKPGERHLELPDAIFISSHLIELIDNAREGERFVHHSIYDGSEDADEVVTGSGVIGESGTYSKPLPGETADAIAPLQGMKAWPVTVSYFDQQADASAERLPVYEASFLLYPNGVSRKLTMRYDDYALVGQLTGLEMLEASDCKK
jgi:EipB-like